MALAPREVENGNGEEALQSSAGEPAVLHERYVINTSEEIKELSLPSAAAFAVEDRRDTGRALYALICRPGMPVRDKVLTTIKGESIRGILPLIDYGTVEWTPYNQKTMAIIYQRPAGGRLIDAIKSKKIKVSEYDLPRRVLEPMAVALRELSPHDIPHRAIRPENLLITDVEKQSIVVGDFASSPPGYDQPLVFEPVDRAMALPQGRGKGDIRDDLYALGVTIVFLLLGKNPVRKMNDNDLLMAKIEQGSYATLCGNERIPVTILEPLRGLLTDIPEERWGLEQLDLWLSGRRLTPMQRKPAVKAESRFQFAGREHTTLRTLVHAFTQHVNEAARVIRKGHLEVWIKRSLKMVELSEAIGAAVEVAQSHDRDFQGSDDYLVSKVAVMLDPKGPIRYKGTAFMLEAFGSLLAFEMNEQGSAPHCLEILNHDMVGLWFVTQPSYTPGHSSQEKLFQMLKSYVKNREPGYGIERCLYDTNPSLPCQSPLIAGEYVTDITELLPALDRASNRVDTSQRPVDRHIAAFVANRMGQEIDPHLRAFGAPDEDRQINGMVSLIAYLQWKHGPDALLGLTSWVGGLLGPAINSYHARSVRREMERAIPRLVRQGSLPDLYDLIENMEKRKEDENGFAEAMDEFAEAEAEIQQVEASDGNHADTAERKGQEAAAMTSILLMMFIMAILLLLKFV